MRYAFIAENRLIFAVRAMCRMLPTLSMRRNGSVSASTRSASARGMAPKAILFDRANTILAQGAAFAGLTLVDRFAAGCPTTLIRTGDELQIEPAKGLVTILNRDA